MTRCENLRRLNWWLVMAWTCLFLVIICSALMVYFATVYNGWVEEQSGHIEKMEDILWNEYGKDGTYEYYKDGPGEVGEMFLKDEFQIAGLDWLLGNRVLPNDPTQAQAAAHHLLGGVEGFSGSFVHYMFHANILAGQWAIWNEAAGILGSLCGTLLAKGALCLWICWQKKDLTFRRPKDLEPVPYRPLRLSQRQGCHGNLANLNWNNESRPASAGHGFIPRLHERRENPPIGTPGEQEDEKNGEQEDEKEEIKSKPETLNGYMHGYRDLDDSSSELDNGTSDESHGTGDSDWTDILPELESRPVLTDVAPGRLVSSISSFHAGGDNGQAGLPLLKDIDFDLLDVSTSNESLMSDTNISDFGSDELLPLEVDRRRLCTLEALMTKINCV